MHHTLQITLAKCNPADGICAIEWLNEDCLVQTYFAEQLGPANCPDAPCPPGTLHASCWTRVIVVMAVLLRTSERCGDVG